MGFSGAALVAAAALAAASAQMMPEEVTFPPTHIGM